MLGRRFLCRIVKRRRNCRRTYLLTGHAVKNLVPDELQLRTLESIRMCFLVVEVYASMRSVETNYS